MNKGNNKITTCVGRKWYALNSTFNHSVRKYVERKNFVGRNGYRSVPTFDYSTRIKKHRLTKNTLYGTI